MISPSRIRPLTEPTTDPKIIPTVCEFKTALVRVVPRAEVVELVLASTCSFEVYLNL